MKYLVAIAMFFVVSCVSCAKAAPPPAPESRPCTAPPSEYKQGMRFECKQTKTTFACVYVFLAPNQETVCGYILAQPMAACWQDFQEVGFQCSPPPEDHGTTYKRKNEPDADVDEGWNVTI